MRCRSRRWRATPRIRAGCSACGRRNLPAATQAWTRRRAAGPVRSLAGVCRARPAGENLEVLGVALEVRYRAHALLVRQRAVEVEQQREVLLPGGVARRGVCGIGAALPGGGGVP